jgi:hypothetical protein
VSTSKSVAAEAEARSSSAAAATAAAAAAVITVDADVSSRQAELDARNAALARALDNLAHAQDSVRQYKLRRSNPC